MVYMHLSLRYDTQLHTFPMGDEQCNMLDQYTGNLTMVQFN